MSEPRSWNETANIVEKAKKEVGTSISTAKEEIISTVKKTAEDNDMLDAIYGRTYEFDKAGTYTVTIPEYVKRIRVTACGAGGGAVDNDYCGGGGGGGAAIVNQEFDVTPGSTLTITVGKGGASGTSSRDSAGKNGGATVIGSILTLAGGGGAYHADNYTGKGGLAGGAGGGAGGDGSRSYGSTAGQDGILGKGGSSIIAQNASSSNSSGGGGGGSLGDGGTGKDNVSDLSTKNGVRGGGGGGTYKTDSTYAGNGGDGYVKICWGL